MSDRHDEMLLQQLRAKPVSGEHLELLGKTAAAGWLSGKYSRLTDAVVAVVKEASLGPEQVKRVVEFANTDAFLKEFKKESAAHRVVHFDSGPADPAEVLHTLNGGAYKTASVSGNGVGNSWEGMDKSASAHETEDYSNPPRETKKASFFVEEDFVSELQRTESPYPYANPVGPLYDMRTKLASLEEHLTTTLSGLEGMYGDLEDRVYQQVKQAAMSGYSLGQVVQAWSTVAPSTDHMKVAFSRLTPRLRQEGLFTSEAALGASFGKTASARVNPQHPLVTEFDEYCDTLSKLAQVRAAREEVLVEAGRVEGAIKEAEGGLWGGAKRMAESLAPTVQNAGHGLVKFLVGDGEAAKAIGGAAGGVVRHLPHIAVGVAAKKFYDRSPTAQSLVGDVTGAITGNPYAAPQYQGGYY